METVPRDAQLDGTVLIIRWDCKCLPSCFECQGNGLTLSTQAEGLSLQPYQEYYNAVRLVPENFRDYSTKREIDRDQLMTVLANLTHLLIRANYNSANTALYRCAFKGRELQARASSMTVCCSLSVYQGYCIEDTVEGTSCSKRSAHVGLLKTGGWFFTAQEEAGLTSGQTPPVSPRKA